MSGRGCFCLWGIVLDVLDPDQWVSDTTVELNQAGGKASGLDCCCYGESEVCIGLHPASIREDETLGEFQDRILSLISHIVPGEFTREDVEFISVC